MILQPEHTHILTPLHIIPQRKRYTPTNAMVAHDVRIAKHKPPVSVSSEQDGHVMHVATRAAPALMLIGHRGQAVKQVCNNRSAFTALPSCMCLCVALPRLPAFPPFRLTLVWTAVTSRASDTA